MDIYRPKVISLTKRPGQTFGFFLRAEHGEEGHLVRCLEMGGPAELAGMKDGDRILRVNGAFVDTLPHSEVVDLVRNSGATVAFHILNQSSYKQAKEKGVNLSDPQSTPVENGAPKQTPKAKLCYLVKSSTDFGFSIRSVDGEHGLFITEVIPGSVADRAGVKVRDRLVEVNGDNIENATHDQVVEKIKVGGSSIIFLLVDEETDKFYKSKHIKVGTWLATTKHLPDKPRIIDMTRGSDGYGFLLREEHERTGHFIKDIDRGSPAEREGLKEMDRLVAVNGQAVDQCSHDQVVDKIRLSGNKCCLLVVDKETDQIYEQGKVSLMLFWEENKDANSPPSYTEAINLPVPVKPSTSAPEQEEVLKPKLCRMEKTPTGYGFHLNGIQGVQGQYIKNVLKGGAADRVGLENDDVVVEVNGVNVEQSSHEEVVELIRRSGESLEFLVATKSVYEQLKAKGVTITRLLLGEKSYAQVHSANTPETSRRETPEEQEREREERREEKEEEEEEARSETPPAPENQRRSSVSSSSSEASVDERF